VGPPLNPLSPWLWGFLFFWFFCPNLFPNLNPNQINYFWKLMNRKYFYYIVFGVTFLTFGLVQDYIRPNYEGGNDLIIYFLGVIPNFLPGIGLPSMFYVTIPEIFKPNTSIYRNRLKWSIIISMIGLIGNEFITIYTPGRGVFDWNDIVWTIIGGIVFYFLHITIQNNGSKRTWTGVVVKTSSLLIPLILFLLIFW